MHALVPPHPGPVAAAGALDADIGLTLLVGAPIAVVSWYVGVLLVSRVLGRRIQVDVPEAIFGHMENGEAEAAQGGSGSTRTATTTATRPTFGTVIGLLLLPFVLISFNTVLSTLIEAGVVTEGATWAESLMLLGDTTVALLITTMVAIAVLGTRGRSMATVSSILDDALGPICSIILITGAGGMFGGVLELSGIGQALSSSLSDLGLSLILQAFLISTLLRVAQGSATVALTTAAGLLAPAASSAGLGELQLVLLVVAIAAGATVLSHVNDSGFWLVSRFFGMDEKTTLKTWTVMETTLGLSAFAIAALLWPVAGAL
jgi:GntP family gluconate:H+ symporter